MKNKIVITGSSGFLGKHIVNQQNRDLFYTIGRDSSNDHICDLSETIPIVPKVISKIIHCSGKAHYTPKNNDDSDIFFKVNYLGTKNLLNSLENSLIKHSFIFISSVSVYGKHEGRNINENMKCKPDSAYAKSKYLAERMVINWCDKKKVKYLILRIPLIIGKNPKGNLKSISEIIKSGFYIYTFNYAKKSMVLADDIAKLVLSQKENFGTFNLTDDKDPTVHDFEKQLSILYNIKIKIYSPKFILLIIAIFGTFIEKQL